MIEAAVFALLFLSALFGRLSTDPILEQARWILNEQKSRVLLADDKERIEEFKRISSYFDENVDSESWVYGL